MNSQTEQQVFCPSCKKVTRHISCRQWGKRHQVCQSLDCQTPCRYHADDEAIRRAFNSAAGRAARKAVWQTATYGAAS